MTAEERTDADRIATIEHEADHSPTEVWTALTTDEGLARWMGDGATIEPEVGGELDAPDPVTGRPRRGLVQRIEPRERLEFTWWPIDEPEAVSYVTIVLQPVGAGTRIQVTEHGLGRLSATARAGAEAAAWSWRLAMQAVAVRPVFA